MARSALALLALLLGLSLAGCSAVLGPGSPFDDPSYTVYQYTATDGRGALVAQGRIALQLVFNDAVDPSVPIGEDVGFGVRGVRDLAAAGSTPAATTHAGAGDVGGTVTRGGTLRLDLNAGLADQNVVLTAPGVEPTRPFDGTWSFNTLLGETERGTFRVEVVRPATEFVPAG